MRIRARHLLVPIALTGALLTGCTGQNAQPAGGQTPDPVDTGALLVSLEGVAPGLGDEASIEDADQICQAIDDGEDTDAVDELALELFSDQAEGELTVDDARNAIVIITTDYCGE